MAPGSKSGHRLTDADLVEHVREQVRFLASSSDAFDSGFEGEAKRLAVAIRVLLHDTSSSKSVLGQLGVKEQILYVDTAPPILPGNLAPTPGLVIMRFTGGVGGSYVAPLDVPGRPWTFPPKRFDTWWSRPVTKLPDGTSYCRRDYVLMVANKEGGAHVDPALDEKWLALTRDNALGFMYFEGDETEKPFDRDPALASVRQIAHELEKTFTDQFDLDRAGGRDDLLRGDRGVVVTENVGRNAPCPCGSGKKYKKCHGAQDGTRGLVR